MFTIILLFYFNYILTYSYNIYLFSSHICSLSSFLEFSNEINTILYNREKSLNKLLENLNNIFITQNIEFEDNIESFDIYSDDNRFLYKIDDSNALNMLIFSKNDDLDEIKEFYNKISEEYYVQSKGLYITFIFRTYFLFNEDVPIKNVASFIGNDNIFCVEIMVNDENNNIEDRINKIKNNINMVNNLLNNEDTYTYNKFNCNPPTSKNCVIEIVNSVNKNDSHNSFIFSSIDFTNFYGDIASIIPTDIYVIVITEDGDIVDISNEASQILFGNTPTYPYNIKYSYGSEIYECIMNNISLCYCIFIIFS